MIIISPALAMEALSFEVRLAAPPWMLMERTSPQTNVLVRRDRGMRERWEASTERIMRESDM